MQSNPIGGDRGHGTSGQASAHVLVVDDDPTVAEVVAGYLDRAGHDVARAADGPSALARFARRRPDLVVLDLMLPGMDGFEVCRRMREQGGPVPVIMLTARGDEEDRVLGLETGADDYVTKPFSPRELVLRVESVLRRARLPVPAPGTSPAAGVLRTATLSLDPVARRATREGAELALTLREFDLLAFFLRYPGRAFTREELMSEVWGWDFGDLSTVTVHVRRLRAKIEHDPARPRLIQTVWGVGYRLTEPEAATGNGGAAPPPRDAPGAHGGVGVRGTPAGTSAARAHGAVDVPDAGAAHGVEGVQDARAEQGAGGVLGNPAGTSAARAHSAVDVADVHAALGVDGVPGTPAGTLAPRAHGAVGVPDAGAAHGAVGVRDGRAALGAVGVPGTPAEPPAARAHSAVDVADARGDHGAVDVPGTPAGASAASPDTPPRRSPDPSPNPSPDPSPGPRRSARS